MSHARKAHAACVLRGKIYVVGGNNDNGLVEVVECYGPVNNSWSTVNNVTHNEISHALVAL